jgi:hypothetical protein
MNLIPLIKKNKIYNLFVNILIFIVVIFIIFYLIKFNPFDIINKYTTYLFFIFLILIILAITAIIYLNSKTEINYFKNASIVIICLIIFFTIIFGFIFLIYSPNLINYINISFIIITTIIILTIIYNLFESFINQIIDGQPLFEFLKDFIFFIPCLLLDFIKYIENDIKTTLNITWILLGFELFIILLHFLIPFISKKLVINNSIELLKGPIYTNNSTTLGIYQNLVVKNTNKIIYNYNYSISLSLWIDSQPTNINYNYNKYTSLFNYSNKPNILYNAKTNSLKITCLTNKDKIVTIYKTNKFPYQQWMNFVIVLRTGIMDIFLNKKLVASLEGIIPYMNSDKVLAGTKNGIHGGIKNVLYYNKPLNTNEIMWIN